MPAPKYSFEDEEKRIIMAAEKAISESSILDFKMSHIAQYAGISVGSVYKHVTSKEDVLMALMTKLYTRSQEKLLSLLELDLSVAECCLASILVHPEKVQDEPYALELEQMIGNRALLRRASQKWVDRIAACERRFEHNFRNNLLKLDALDLPDDKKEAAVDELMLGLWAMHTGYVAVAYQRSAASSNFEENPFPLPIDHALIKNATFLINGYPWHEPLNEKSAQKAASILEKIGLR